VHLDVAGTAYTESELPTVPRGPTGVPVGTFVEFVRGRAG
jgi:leucyl aminopeptidase